MAFTKDTFIDKLEIMEDCVMRVRTSKVVYEDGEEVGRRHSRYVLDPGIDVASEVATKTAPFERNIKVGSIVSNLWTQAVIDARKAVLASQLS